MKRALDMAKEEKMCGPSRCSSKINPEVPGERGLEINTFPSSGGVFLARPAAHAFPWELKASPPIVRIRLSTCHQGQARRHFWRQCL